MTIPSSVTSIGNYAFCFCSGLTSVKIPEEVTSIGTYVFSDCSGLEELEFCGAVPTGFDSAEIEKDTFIWYNARYAGKWGKALADYGYEHSAPYKPCSCCQAKGISQIPAAQTIVNVISTNIFAHYVLNSVQPEFAIPPTSDTGFVNIITEVKGNNVAIPATWAEVQDGHEADFNFFKVSVEMR